MIRVIIPIVFLLSLAACGTQDSEPSEADMRPLVNKAYTQINQDVQKIAEECRGAGAIIVNPMKALRCTSVCSFDPKECKKLPTLEMTDFKKLACEKAVGQPGWVCDYEYGVASQSDFIMTMFKNVYGDTTRAQARFFKSDHGSWVMATMK